MARAGREASFAASANGAAYGAYEMPMSPQRKTAAAIVALAGLDAIVGTLTGTAKVLDWIGRGSSIADLQKSDSFVFKALGGLLGVPWLFGMLFVGVTIFLCWIIIHSMRAPIVADAKSGDQSSAERVAPDGTAAEPVSLRKPSFDRLATSFLDKRIKLTDFIVEGGAPLIIGKTFEDCTLYGPAVLNRIRSPLLPGCTHAEQSLYIEVQPDSPLVGAITVEDCTFRRCHFVNVGLAALKAEIPSQMRCPLLAGRVERFEQTNAYYVSEWSKNDLRRTLGREPTDTEVLGAFLRELPGNWYIAWLKIETLGIASKATNWSFAINLKDGGEIPCLLELRDWGAPKTWPNVKYNSLAEAQSMFLENKTLYNIIVHVRLGQSDGELDMASFKARFVDDNGSPIECKMQKLGAG